MNRVDAAAATATKTKHRTYFFLSYAHSAPPSRDVQGDADTWVSVFFQDLSSTVRRQATPSAGMEIGFFDQHIPLGSDWKAVLVDALSSAEVFVPLYSPGYFGKSWPLREQEAFQRRLARAGPTEKERHVAPVLWTPWPSSDAPPQIGEALRLGEDTPEYTENGLRALCRLKDSYRTYRESYTAILDRLANRIVDTAERSPLRPSRAPRLDEVPSTLNDDTAFVVAVIAPTRDKLPAFRSAETYDTSSALWRPFAGRQELPIAEYVANTAERLGLPTRILNFADAGEMLQKCPAVVLIDPWVAAGKDGVEALRSAVQDLPEWAPPLVVIDGDDTQYALHGAPIAADVMKLLSSTNASHARKTREMEEFIQLLPGLITFARRQFLKKGPVFPPSDDQPWRPSLRSPEVTPFPKPWKKDHE